MAARSPFLERRRLSAHPVDVGMRSEATIAHALYARGFEVYTPVNVNSRADFLVDFGERIVRVQAKTGRLKRGAITFRLVSVRSNTKGSFTRGYSGEIDYFAVYCPETRGVYVVPIDDLTGNLGTLRVHPCANNQAVGVRWARDYELPPLETYTDNPSRRDSSVGRASDL